MLHILCSIYICIHVNVHMYDIVYICLDNSEEVHRISVAENSELEELEQMTHSGELLSIFKPCNLLLEFITKDQPLEELKCLWSHMVNETQVLKTELRKKEKLTTQTENG